MKVARSVFGFKSPQPARTQHDVNDTYLKVCEHYDYIHRLGPTIMESLLSGFRIEYRVSAPNILEFVQQHNPTLTLQEVADATQLSIFVKAIPVKRYVKCLQLLLREAALANIYKSHRGYYSNAVTPKQLAVVATLLCHIGWEGIEFIQGNVIRPLYS